MPLHPDFEKIRRNFIKRYGKEKGERFFYSWINKYGLDDTKPLSEQKDKLRRIRAEALGSKVPCNIASFLFFTAMNILEGEMLGRISAQDEGEYHHIRVKDPEYFDPDSFRYIKFDEGILALVGCPKGKFKGGRCTVGTEVQKVIFEKKRFTREEAERWVREHFGDRK